MWVDPKRVDDFKPMTVISTFPGFRYMVEAGEPVLDEHKDRIDEEGRFKPEPD